MICLGLPQENALKPFVSAWSQEAKGKNIQHPTSNIEHPMAPIRTVIGCWVLFRLLEKPRADSARIGIMNQRANGPLSLALSPSEGERGIPAARGGWSFMKSLQGGENTRIASE